MKERERGRERERAGGGGWIMDKMKFLLPDFSQYSGPVSHFSVGPKKQVAATDQLQVAATLISCKWLQL